MSDTLARTDDATPTLTKDQHKALVQQTGVGVPVRSVEEAVMLAKTFAASGLFKDARDAAQCVAKIMMGAEFGLMPAASMNAIHIVQGKMQLSGTMIATLINRSGRYKYRITEHTADACAIEFFERDGNGWESLGVEKFDQSDAKRQGTQNVAKFPKNMLFARAISNGARFYTADIFGGQPVYTEGEIEEQPAAPEFAPGHNRADEIKARIRPVAPDQTALTPRQTPALEAPEEPASILEQEASDWVTSLELSAEDKEWLVTFRSENENWASRFIDIRDSGVTDAADLRSLLTGEDLFA